MSIAGSYCTLYRFDPYVSFPHDLYQNLKDPEIWKYMNSFAVCPYGSEYNMQEIFKIVTQRTQSYIICRKDQTDPIGKQSTVEICNVFFSKKLQRRRSATEAMFILISLCFDIKKYKTIQWRANFGNTNSIRAAQRFGFKHIDYRWLDGLLFWYAIFSIDNWNTIKKQYERWLNKNNFYQNGLQKTKLVVYQKSLPQIPNPSRNNTSSNQRFSNHYIPFSSTANNPNNLRCFKSTQKLNNSQKQIVSINKISSNKEYPQMSKQLL